MVCRGFLKIGTFSPWSELDSSSLTSRVRNAESNLGMVNALECYASLALNGLARNFTDFPNYVRVLLESSHSSVWGRGLRLCWSHVRF